MKQDPHYIPAPAHIRSFDACASCPLKPGGAQPSVSPACPLPRLGFPRSPGSKQGSRCPPQGPLQRVYILGCRTYLLSGGVRPRDGEGGDPGARWIRTTWDDKVGSSSSACTDRKGTVTSCPHSLSKHSSEPLADPTHGRVPPRHTWPARPVRPHSAVKTSTAVEAHRCGPGPATVWCCPSRGLGSPTHFPAPPSLAGQCGKKAPEGPLTHNTPRLST